MESSPQIYDLIPKVMASVGEIGKNKANTQQNYKFRGIDDALNYCGPAFRQHNVTPSVAMKDREFSVSESEAIDKNGNKRKQIITRVGLLLTLRLSAPDGSYVESSAYGEGLDYNGDKATNKAMSAAMKYALFLGLVLPIEAQALEENDYDDPQDDEQPKARKPRTRTPQRPKAPQPKPPPAPPPPQSDFDRGRDFINACGDYDKLNTDFRSRVDGNPNLSAGEKERLNTLLTDKLKAISRANGGDEFNAELAMQQLPGELTKCATTAEVESKRQSYMGLDLSSNQFAKVDQLCDLQLERLKAQRGGGPEESDEVASMKSFF